MTLLDIMAQANYPKVYKIKGGVGKAFEKFYDENIYDYEFCEASLPNGPEAKERLKWLVNGEIIYKLRCDLLHNGSNKQLKKKLMYKYGVESEDILHYELINPLATTLGKTTDDSNNLLGIKVRINVPNLIRNIVSVAKVQIEIIPEKYDSNPFFTEYDISQLL